MAINPLQLPSSQAFSGGIDWSPLAALGTQYKEAQKEQKLSELGKQLSSGNVDYRQAAGTLADLGSVTGAVQLLGLAEAKQKQADELDASKSFRSGLQNMFTPQALSSSPQPTGQQASNGYGNAISSIESGGKYDALGPVTKTGDRAYGKYQVMGANIPEWTRTHLGQEMTPDDFLASPQAQDAVFKGQFGQYTQKYGPEGAAKAWFAGEGGMNNPNAKDQLGTTVSAYANKFTRALGPQATYQVAGPAVAAPTGDAVAPVPESTIERAASASGNGLPSGLTPRALSLIGASSNPRLPQTDRETAKLLLSHELDNSKATSDMKEWAFAKAQDPSTPDYTSWTRANKAAGKTEISIDTKGESAFATASGGALAKRFEKLSEEGETAKSDLALIGQLRDLSGTIKTGAPAAIQSKLAEYGIKVGDNIGAVEAYGSIIDKLTPQQRIPGSGATSDYEGKMFKSSLPRLINTPEGNSIIESTLAGLAQYKLDRAAIAEKGLTREITQADALKQMRELPSPYANFKEFAKSGFRADTNNPASAATPLSREQSKRFTEPEIQQSFDAARAAIAAGKSRDAVIQRLRESGLDPSAL